jgi:hypothetical protein
MVGLTMQKNYISVYIETAQLALSMSDFIAIANANKIEYSIRFGSGSIENIFTDDQVWLFKSFYNSSFDEDFEFGIVNEYFEKSQKLNSANSKEWYQKDSDDIVLQKNISTEDLNEIKRLSEEMSNMGVFSLKKGTLRNERNRVFSKYNLSFYEIGTLLKKLGY